MSEISKNWSSNIHRYLTTKTHILRMSVTEQKTTQTSKPNTRPTIYTLRTHRTQLSHEENLSNKNKQTNMVKGFSLMETMNLG